MRVQLKKFLTQITAVAVIFWSLGPAAFIGSLPADAAVSTLTATAIASRNHILGGSSPATAVLGLNVAQNAGEQLSQVVVTLDPPRDGNNNPTSTITPADFANLTTDANSGVALYKDNQAGGVKGVFDATDTVVTLAGAPSFNTNTQFVRLTPSAPSVIINQNIPLADGDLVLTRTSSDTGYTWHIVKTGNTGNEGPINSQGIRLENTANFPAFSDNFQVSKFTPEATGNFTINGTANTAQFSSGATPALSVGDIILYSGGSTLSRWGMVSGAFTATNAPVDGQNLANETYRMSRVAGVTGGYSVPISGAITVTGALNGAPLTAGDMVLYRDTSTTNQAQWGVVTNATLTSGLFAIDGVPLAPGTTATPKSYQITKLNAYVNATKLLTNNAATNVDVGTVAYALVTSNIEVGATIARNTANWHMVTTAGTVTNGTENLKLKLNSSNGVGSAGYPVFGNPSLLRVTLAANALQAVPANDTDADKLGADYFIVIKSAAAPTANNAFRASIASTYFTATANQIAAVVTPTYTFNPSPATFLAVAQQQIGANVFFRPSSDTYYALRLNLAHSNLPSFRALRVVVNPSGTSTMNDLAPITDDATSGITLLKDNKGDAGGRGVPNDSDTFTGNTFEGTNREFAVKRTIQSSHLSRITPTATITDNGNTVGGTLAVTVGDAVFARLGAGSYRWYMVTGAGNLSSDATEGTAVLDRMDAANSRVVAGSQISKLTPQNGTGVLTVGGEANTTTVNLAADDIIFYQKGMDVPKWDIVTSASASDISTLGTPLSNGTYQVSKFTPDTVRTGYAVGDIVLYQNNSNFAGDTQFAIITGFDRDAADMLVGYTLSSGETVPLARLVKFTGFAQLSKDTTATDYALSDGDMVLSMPTKNPLTTTTNWHVVTQPNVGASGMTNAVRFDDITSEEPRFNGTVVVLTPGVAGNLTADDIGNNVQSDYFVGVRTSPTATDGNAFTVSVAPDSLVLNSAQQGTFNQPLTSSTSVIFTVLTQSSLTTNAVANIAGAPVTIVSSSNPTAVFGLNAVTNAGVDPLKKVSVTVNPVTGFVMSELAALGTTAQSGIALYQDNKAGGTSFGSFNTTDDAVVPLSSITSVQQGPRLTTIAPSSQALATAQMTITAGDALFTHITGNGAPLNAYAWHMATANGTANTAPSGDGALRLDGAGALPTFVGGAHVSRLSARTTGSYVINGRTNTNPSALKTGDIILYHTGTTAARWGVVSRNFDAGNAVVDGVQLPNGTYRISKFSPQFSQVTAQIGFQQGSSYTTSSSTNWTQMQVGDVVLYQTGTESARWGVVTNASTTGGTFAINGTPLTVGNGYNKTYRFSKLDSTLTQTILAFSDGFQAPLGSLTFAFTTSNAQNPTAFDWHAITTAGAVNGSAIRFDGNGAGAPVYGTRVTMNINPANFPDVPTDNNGNNANHDFYIVVRTSATAVANDSFLMALAPGDITTASHTPLASPNALVSQLHTISSAPIAPPPPTTATAAIRAAEFPLALKASSSEAALFRVRFGTNENTKNLTSVKIQLSPSSGTPTWTTGAAVSSDLADLATGAASGISLWKDNGDLLFATATDTNVTLAANPVYAASDLADVNARSFTMTLATPQVIVSGDAYFMVVKTKATPGNNNRFNTQLTATGVTTSGASPNLGTTILRDITIDTSVPTIQSITGQPGTNTLEVLLSESAQKSTGGSLAYVSSTDPFTFTDGGGTVQQISAIDRRSDNAFTITMNGNLTDEDFDSSPATLGATAGKIVDFAGNVMATTVSNLVNSTRITTESLPAATAGQQYLSQGQPVTFQAVGGTQPYGWTPSGAQDATTLTNLGLTLASNTGLISGTIPAQASGTHTFTAKLRDTAFTATLLTGAAGANPWAYQKGGYVPTVGDMVFYRNVTDAPTAMNFGIVTAAPAGATRTNQDTFRVNGALLLPQKVYQMTQFRTSFPETSAIAANGNFTQGLNLRTGDFVFYPTNATATTYDWGLVSTAQNITANNPATTLRVNGNALPAYSATGQIQLVRASEPGFYSRTAVVTVNNGAAWTINSGQYNNPSSGNIVLYRNVTDEPTIVRWGVITAATNTNQEVFKINNAALLAGKQYQISEFSFSNMSSQSLVGTNQSNFQLDMLDGNVMFLPTQSNGTVYNWALVTGGDAIIPANTNITGLKLNGSAVDMAWENGAGGSLIISASPPALTLSRSYTINVAGSDGRIANIDRVEKDNVAFSIGVVGTTVDGVTISGVNTSFAANSTIEILNSSNTVISTEGAATATNVQISNKASTGATNLTFRMVIGAQVAQGSYQLRVTSGNQVVSRLNAFSIGAAQAAGLNLLSPFDNAMSVPIPPTLSFAPSTNAGVQSYRVTVNTSSNFNGITVWDYAFPKVAPSGIPGHCSGDQCSVTYGEGRFRNIQDPNFDPSNANTPSRPAPLAPNTPYYWKVEAYSLAYTDATIGAAGESRSIGARILEAKPDGGLGRAFTTTNTIADSEAPDIQFVSSPKATASTDLNVFARVLDRIARPNGTPALTARVFYCNTANCTPTTVANAVHVGSNFFKFTIPAATIGVAGTITSYYLEATDGPNFASVGTAPSLLSSPLYVTSVAAGSGTISGTVKKLDGTCDPSIRQAVLFMEGTGFNATSSNDAACTFALNGLTAGGYVWAIKDGYEPIKIGTSSGLPLPLASTNIDIRLSFNQGGGFIGGGGAAGNPFVMQHFPGPEAREIPQTARIDIFFDRAMDFGTIGSTNMTVQDEANGVFTDITNRGAWTYIDDTTATPAKHRATWTLTGQNTLGAGKKIVAILTNGVKAGGISIDTPDSFNSQPAKKFSFITTSLTCSEADFIARTCGGTAIALDKYPRVMNWSLPPNMFSVPTNSPLSVNFSVDMKENVGSNPGDYNLINSVRLYQIINGQPSDITSTAVNSVALDTVNKSLAIMTLKNSFNNGQLAANTEYELKVLAAAAALNGAILGQDYPSPRFRTSGGADTGAPLIVGPSATMQMTIPSLSRKFTLNFNKPLRPESVSTNTIKVYQRGSTSPVSGVGVRYDNNVNVDLEFSNPLSEQTIYDIKATVGSSGVVGGNGVALAAETAGQTAVTRSFTTLALAGTIDAQPSRIEYVKANENKIVVKFTKPMNNNNGTSVADLAKSVTNKNNITIEYGSPPGTDPRLNPGFSPAANPAEGTANVFPNTDQKRVNLSFSSSNELIIDNWTSVAPATIIGKKLYVSIAATVEDTGGTPIDSALDLGFNQIIGQNTTLGGQAPCGQGNSRCTVVESTAVMGAAIAMGEFNKPLEMRGQETLPDFMAGKPIGHIGQVEVFPHNSTAGELSSYTIRLPITEQISAGGAIQLAFPEGFDVTGAKQRPFSPTWSDFNRDNAGTITFKCSASIADTTSCAGGETVIGDRAANVANNADAVTRGGLADDGVVVVSRTTVKVYLSAATRSSGTDQTDDIEFELSDIRNAPNEMNFSSTNNVVSISALLGLSQVNKRKMESLPLMIRAAGTLQITGTITAPGNAANGTVRVYLEGPGFKETTSTDFNGTTTATFTFTGVQSNTSYFVRLDPSNTLGANTYVLSGGGIPVFVNSANATVDLPLVSTSVGGTVFTVTITGGPANQKLDVFANSMHGQNRFAEVTLDGNGTNGAGTQIRLADDQWFVGVGPHIPRGKFTGPPPRVAAFIPPPVSVNIKSTDNPACSGGGVVNCGLALAFTATTKQIRGKVIDSTNAANVMVGAEVSASSSTQGRRFTAVSTGDGSFTIDVVPGSYKVEARVMGMAPSPEQTVNVTTAAQNYLEISSINNGAALSPETAATQFILKPISSALTIQGTVSDASGTPVKEMAVYGYRTDGPGFANSMTDQSGIYRLYISPGTWKVGSYISGFGKVEERTVTVTTTSQTGQDLSAASGGRTYRKITGRVYRDTNANNTYDIGEGLGNTLIKVVNGAAYQNRDVTKSDGTYIVNVPDGTGYRVKAFSMDLGGELPPLAAFDVTGADVANKDFRVTSFRTVTFTVAGGTINEGVIELRSSTGFRVSSNIQNGALPVLSVPDGSYVVEVRTMNMPLTASDIAATDVNTTTYAVAGSVGTVTVNGNEGLTITLPVMRTITGTVRDANNQLVGEAGIEIFNDASHVALSTATAANGTFTLTVPNAANKYILNASKTGYLNTFREMTITAAVDSAALLNLALTLTKATLSIGGQIKIGAAGVPKARVYAEKLGGGFASTIADSDGNYSLPVQAGSWDVFASTDGYAKTPFTSNPIVVAAAVTSKDITLTQTVTTNAPVSQALSPTVGGSIEDASTGTSLIIAANVLPTQTSTNLQIKDTQNFSNTDTTKVAGGAAKEITAEDSNGSSVTTLKGGATVQLTLTKAQLLASVSSTDSSINTKTEVEQLSVSFFDDVAGQWKSLPTTFTYKDAAGAIVSSVNEDLSTIASVVLSAITTHFSLFAPTVKTNPTAPSVPTGLAVTSPTSSSLTLTWTAVAGATGYSIYRDTAANGAFPRIGADPTVSSGTTTSYVDTGLANNTSYFYKITANNANGESEASATVTNATSSTTTTSSSGGGGGGGTAIVSGTGGSTTSAATTSTTPAKTAAQPAQQTPVQAAPQVVAPSSSSTETPVSAVPVTQAAKPAPQAAPVAQALSQVKGLSTIARAITKGSKGSDVTTLQQVLKAEGLYKGPVNGILDAKTLASVKSFQVVHNISKPGQKAYGNIGPDTRAAVNAIVKQAVKIQKAAIPAVPAAPATPAKPAQPAVKQAPVPTKEEQVALKAAEAAKKKEALNAAIEKASEVLEVRYTSEDEMLGLMKGVKTAKSTAAMQKKAGLYVKKLTSVLESKALKTVLNDLLLNLPEPVKKIGMDAFADALARARKAHNNAIPQDPQEFADFVQEAMNMATSNK